MAKRRLPPMEPGSRPLRGPDVEGISVGSWCPTPDGSGKPECVALSIDLKDGCTIVCRLKTPQTVDAIIQALLRHKRDVWPDAR